MKVLSVPSRLSVKKTVTACDVNSSARRASFDLHTFVASADTDINPLPTDD